MRFLRAALLSVFLSVSLQVAGQTVSINEVMASNATTLADEDGDFEDWIELYNYGTTPINPKGFGLAHYDNGQVRRRQPAFHGPDKLYYSLAWLERTSRKGCKKHNSKNCSCKA